MLASSIPSLLFLSHKIGPKPPCESDYYNPRTYRKAKAYYEACMHDWWRIVKSRSEPEIRTQGQAQSTRAPLRRGESDANVNTELVLIQSEEGERVRERLMNMSTADLANFDINAFMVQ